MSNITMHVLLADDDQDDRLFFSDAFSDLALKIKLKMVNDGEELMKYLKTPNIILPSVVFLDLNMPRKNGIDCLKEIRNNDTLKNLSVAIYSTSTNEKDIEETLANGANVYIAKPSNFTKLQELLERILETNWQFHTARLNRDNYFISM